MLNFFASISLCLTRFGSPACAEHKSIALRAMDIVGILIVFMNKAGTEFLMWLLLI